MKQIPVLQWASPRGVTVSRDTLAMRSATPPVKIAAEAGGPGAAASRPLPLGGPTAWFVCGYLRRQGLDDATLRVVADDIDLASMPLVFYDTGGSTWLAVTLPFDAPTDATVRLVVDVAGSGAIWLDDLRLVERVTPHHDPDHDSPLADASGSPGTAAAPDATVGWSQVVIGSCGTVTGFAQHPADVGVAYMAVDVGGLHRWEADEGRWTPLFEHLGPGDQAGLHTECVALDPADPDRVYVTSGKEKLPGVSAIYRSNDRGRTWQRTILRDATGRMIHVTNGRTGHRLAVDPHDGRVLLYGSRQDGLFQSTDAGATWEIVAFAGKSVAWVVFDPARAGVILAAADAAVWRSDDGGVTWHKLAGLPPGAGKSYGRLGPDGALYLTFGRTFGRWRDDRFEDLTPPDVRHGLFAFDVAAYDPNVMVVGEQRCGWDNGIHRTLDGGRTWTRFGDDDYGRGSGRVRHGDVQPWEHTTGGGPHVFACLSSLNFDAAHRGRVWFTHWPGVAQIRDIAADVLTWDARFAGHEELCLYDLIAPPKGAPLFSAGMDVAGYRHEDIRRMPPSVVRGVGNRDGMPAPNEVSQLDFCETDPDRLVMAAGWRYNSTGNAGYSTDNGVTWQPFEAKPFPDARNGRIAVDCADPQTLVWLPMGDAAVPHVTRDNGRTWTACRGAPQGLVFGGHVFTFYMPLAADRGQSGVFYLYDHRDGRFYRSDDAGDTFRHVSRLPANRGGYEARHRVMPAPPVPGKPGQVWVNLDAHGLFHSADAGESWTRVPGVESAVSVGFGTPARAEGPPALYLLGRVAGDDAFTLDTQIALYQSDDDARTWQRLSDPAKLGFARAVCTAGDRQTPGRAYVATDGRGVYVVGRT